MNVFIYKWNLSNVYLGQSPHLVIFPLVTLSQTLNLQLFCSLQESGQLVLI